MTRPIALITGASSGIGADLAREAANDGYDVVLSARRVEPMRALASELETYGAATTILAADLSKSGGAQELTGEIARRALRLGNRTPPGARSRIQGDSLGLPYPHTRADHRRRSARGRRDRARRLFLENLSLTRSDRFHRRPAL